MVESSAAVIKGVIAALKASAPVAALVGTRIYSDVPQNEPFPYLVVSLSSEPFAANDFSGQEHTVRFQAFSRASSLQEASLIRAAVLTALDRNEAGITLEAGTLVKCEYSGFSDASKEDDGRTWQAVGELQVIVV